MVLDALHHQSVAAGHSFVTAGSGDCITRLHRMGAPASLHNRKRHLFVFPTMQLVECLLHSRSLAILLCGLPNTSALHCTSMDSPYAAYQTPPKSILSIQIFLRSKPKREING
jgi:hypothetical protein